MIKICNTALYVDQKCTNHNVMRNDWNDLQIFLALEREGTARAAATRLKCSHSTISRRLDALESRFGTKLFDRTPEGFTVNASGARILARAQQIEAEMLELERSVIGDDIRLQGDIRLTAPPPLIEFLLLPILQAFRDQYPLINIELVPSYGYADLSRRDADIAIRFSEKPDDHLVGRRLPEFRDSIYASPAYIAAHWPDGKPEWISWADDAAFAKHIKATPFPKASTSWRIPSLHLQAEAAAQGLGMASLPIMMGDSNPRLVRVPDAGVQSSRPAWLLTHPDLRRMERVRVFAKFLAEAIVAKADFVGGEGSNPTP